SRGLAAAVSERRRARVPRLHSRLDLVPDQVVRVSLRLHLGAGDAAALPLRPVDAARVEGVDSTGDCESGCDGNRKGAFDVVGTSPCCCCMGQAIAFYTLAFFILFFAVL